MKNKYLLVLSTIILVFTFSGCTVKNTGDSSIYVSLSSGNTSGSTVSTTAVYKKITAQVAKTMMDQNKDAIILDVRTLDEFNEGHIKGALLIPDNEILTKAEDVLTDKAALILVYCRSGRRSELAAKALLDLGYTNVYDFGGINDWDYGIVK